MLFKMQKKLILPGVGAFDYGMNNIHDYGLFDILNEKALVEKVPILGICLGMQLLSNGSEEGSEKGGFGWIDSDTIKFQFPDNDKTYRLPHMGWNYVDVKNYSNIFKDMRYDDKGPKFYFVHTYHVRCNDSSNVLSTTYYGRDFHSAIYKDNIMGGTQFHPEKSHKYGMQLLRNFVEIK